MKDGRGWKALRLEEVDSLPWANTELEWRPLREALEHHRRHGGVQRGPSGTGARRRPHRGSFEPSASEWIERARPHIRSNPALAWEIVEELRSARPRSPGIRIAEALLAVGAGEMALATRKLGEVLHGEPGLRTALAQDPDLASRCSTEDLSPLATK